MMPRICSVMAIARPPAAKPSGSPATAHLLTLAPDRRGTGPPAHPPGRMGRSLRPPRVMPRPAAVASVGRAGTSARACCPTSPEMTMTETAIAEHGVIGDLQTAALVSTDGSIDWFCCPRFDSPSVFGALLDEARGGLFRIRPARGDYTTTQMYLPDTAVLVTRFSTEAGAGEVVDFMPPAGTTATNEHRIVRMVRCIRGTMKFDIEVAPRFDYGRAPHEMHLSEDGAVFTSNGSSLTLSVVREPEDGRKASVELWGEDLRASLDLVAGDVRG